MKKMIYLSLLFLLTLNNLKANDGIGLEGFYTNPQTYSEIEVDIYNKGIKVRGIDRKHPYKWVKFRRVNRYVFADGRGTEIKIKNRDRHGEPRLLVRGRRGDLNVYNRGVIHHSHRPHTTCTTIIDHRSDWDNYDDYDNEYYKRRGYDNRTDNGSRKDRYQNNDNYNDGYDQSQGFGDNYSNKRLEGTYVTNDGRHIALLETRDGFKAKFEGDRNWKSYTRQNENFVDHDGNFYRLSGVNEMKWTGKYSGKVVIIKKIDDKVQF